ncbi:hypothetical protein GCM10010329_81130 [Streptomyces spiroverticillatus]|uniref:Uncharacterized protein n=1 Tax=Streptomyces finlayi TaxID=67296 RepID=A0A918X834_9ACTN|nr:hypothetical protein GCM10010329_81130 [Streptomyces spiroverticillatus]GHD16348.1 hypothetical protein GCM10010334_77370 [Streptomyces finlayi]
MLEFAVGIAEIGDGDNADLSVGIDRFELRNHGVAHRDRPSGYGRAQKNGAAGGITRGSTMGSYAPSSPPEDHSPTGATQRQHTSRWQSGCPPWKLRAGRHGACAFRPRSYAQAFGRYTSGVNEPE